MVLGRYLIPGYLDAKGFIPSRSYRPLVWAPTTSESLSL